jgi:hypothetical protein
MSHISGSTNVYIWTYHPPHSGQRAWVATAETVRNNLGQLILKAELDDDPKCAASFRYDVGIIAKRRFESEGYFNPAYHDFHFSLSPTGEEIASGNTTSAPDKDNRTVMIYKGIVARPYIPRGWCVHLYDGKMQLESVRGETIEEAVDKVIERNLLKFAEKYEQPEPEPAPSAPTNSYGGARVRPGSLK